MIDLNKMAKTNKSIREHTDDLLKGLLKLKRYNYIDKKLYELLKKTCEYHDYGKVNDEFQKRILSNNKFIFNNSKEVGHNILSLCFFCEKDFDSIEDYLKVAYAILNHHHYTDNYKEVKDKKKLIDSFIKKFGGKKITERLIDKISQMSLNKEAILIKGFLHKCDYSASGDYNIEYPNNFLLNTLKNLDFKGWRDVQKYTMENRDENLIVVASTGIGKTEAGLLWIGDNKGFFILPLRTALNAMYKRIKNDIVIDKIDERLALLHSSTLSVYIHEAVVEDDKILEYQSKGKNLTMPLTLATLDQLFDFVYKYNGFELKLATFSYSKIVLDEIQAYSADLIAYIISALEMIYKVGGKFAIITATLPPFIQSLLEKNIGKIKNKSFITGKDRHYLKIIEDKINSKDIEEFYREKQGKILVVCNTIGQAQNIYCDLVNKGFNLNLLHSKFIKKERNKKEEEIIKFGDTNCMNNGIWISTSLVEASLDIDFDYLFTELNDLNGLFQRLGRINRRGKKGNMLNAPNAFVYIKINKNLLVKGNKGFIDSDIYNLSKEVLLKFGKGILKEEKKSEMINKNFTLEKLKNSDFVRRYYKVKEYLDNLYIGEKSLKEVQKYFRNIIAYSVIPKEIYEDRKIQKILKTNETLLKEKYTYNKSLSRDENKRLKDKFFLNQQKLRDEIEKYTVSVGIYDLNKTGKTINTGFEIIPIVNCKYDNNIGFIRVKMEKGGNINKFDAFS